MFPGGGNHARHDRTFSARPSARVTTQKGSGPVIDPVLPDGFNTRAVAAHEPGTRANRPLSPPVHRSTTFEAASAEEHARLFHGGAPTFYQRFGNPTTAAAAGKIAELESAESALVFSSGMGAISTALLAVLRAGDHVVAQDAIFDQTHRMLAGPLAELGVETTFLDPRVPGAVERALRPNTKLIYLETPSNPMLHVVELAPLCALARTRGILLFVDGTFASPALQRPIALGASLSLHSATKYLGGHSDVMAGSAAGAAALVARIREMQILLGTVLAPDAAWLLLRGIRTLGLRVARQSRTAASLARYLAAHGAVAEVRYPFLDGFDNAAAARAQMSGGGGMITFRIRAGGDAAAAFVERLKLIVLATSLGGVESVIELPFDLDFVDPSGQRPAWVRFSVGLEDEADLRADLEQALR